MRQRLLGEERHIDEVRQAMSEYEERKRRETQARYQRRLFIFAENQEQIASERAGQWEEKSKKIEAAKKSIVSKEKSFREKMKDKLSHKMERFKENHSRYTFHRRESARMKRDRLNAAQMSKQKQIEQHQAATAEKIKVKQEVHEEKREASLNLKVAKIQEKQAKIQENKKALQRDFEINTSIKMMELEVRLDQSAVKRQLREQEIQVKARAHHEKAMYFKRLKEEKERRFSDCTEENLRLRFEKAEHIRKQNANKRLQDAERKTEREHKAKTVVGLDKGEKEKLREKIEEKYQRSEENRAAILNAKVEQCQRESMKVYHTKENADKLVRNQEKAANDKLEAKLNSYKENRQRRLNERKEKAKPSPCKKKDRAMLGNITNEEINSPTKHCSTSPEWGNFTKISPDMSSKANAENEFENMKQNELAENFRNRNLEFLGLR